MSENNKSYRIRTNVGSEYNGEIRFDVNLLQDYDEFEILSLKIGTENLYKYHTSKYGCVVGRVLANGGVGVPNVKISSFIPVEDIDTADPVFSFLYPYTSTRDKNRDNIRYNLLTDTKIDDCHQPIGTFPTKRLVLDDNNVIEIYDKYYKFTTTTNGSGDYMLFGLPVGNNIIHSDLDLSDIGILSQKPRDLFYKGYTAKQFENASQFKKDTNLDNLTQVMSQDSSVYVFPFWGDEKENEGQIKIVRNDIDVNYKFEPTCIFIGCIVSDEKSNAISKNCIPHERMGKMDRLTTGAGTIEMIRKTMSGDIESITIQGNNLIDGNGTWCYQIPMNLDYVATDEYGNLVPTDNYDKGLPTRTSVRFRVSLADYESDYENAHLVKVLVPNNPDIQTKEDSTKFIDYDYEFGSATQDESFRDMLWNNVYTVKSYIPRFQKGNRQRNKNFTGFKAVNVNGANNPIPYNNMRINLTFLFVFQCLIFKSLILIVKTLNKIIYALNELNCNGDCCGCGFTCTGDEGLVYLTLDGGMCPTLDGNFIAPGAVNINSYHIIEHTYKNVYGESYKLNANISDTTFNRNKEGVDSGTALPNDNKSADGKNSDLIPDPITGIINKSYTPDDVLINQSGDTSEQMKIFNKEDYFIKCVELQFAMEYEVIQFDFYNDWINGMIYIPRWFAEIRKNKDNAYYCGDTFRRNRLLTQQCAIGYDNKTNIQENYAFGCRNKEKQKCHKRWGRRQIPVFGRNRGIVTAQKNSRGQYAYYLRPSELFQRGDYAFVKANLFSTDIVLLGSVLDCNQYGIPNVNGYTSSSYRMPPPTAEIVSDTQEMILDVDNLTYNDVKKFALNEAISIANSSIMIYIGEILNKKYTIEQCDYNTEGRGTYYLETGYSAIPPIPVSCNQKKEEDVSILRNIVNKYYNSDEEITINNLLNKQIDGNGIIEFINKKSATPLGLDVYNTFKIDNIDIEELNYSGLSEIVETQLKMAYALIHRKIKGSNIYQFRIISKLLDAFEHKFDASSPIIGLIAANSKINYDRIINSFTGKDDITYFHVYDKREVYNVQLDEENEPTYSELSGIDWGYDPFKTGSDDDTSLMQNQIAGHFLEIGCTFSLSNIKSCVNLQRVCEIGGEISQSHYYYDGKNHIWNLLDPTGIIAKREVIDAGIRSSFATLNSKNLGTMLDPKNGYKKYEFISYSPVSFMGDLMNRNEISNLVGISGKRYQNYGLVENQSLSYRAFRFNTTSETVDNKYLIKEGNGSESVYYMPQYENSFYFYFGLRDGNTAIDRLYSEYYAPCDVDTDTPEVLFTVSGTYGEGFDLHYITQNMARIKSVTVKYSDSGIKLKRDEGYTWDKKKSIINVPYTGKYIIRLKDTSNQVVKSIVVCTENDYKDDYDITFSCIYFAHDPTYSISYLINPIFKVNKIYVNGESVEFIFNEQEGNGIFTITNTGMNEIVFENQNNERLVRYFNTDFDVTINNVSYNGTYCTVSYESTWADLSLVESEAVYDENGRSMGGYTEYGLAKSAVYDIDLVGKKFKIWNGYNYNGNNDITVYFKNQDNKITVVASVETNPTFELPAEWYPCRDLNE
jgi:hypothetical protein